MIVMENEVEKPLEKETKEDTPNEVSIEKDRDKHTGVTTTEAGMPRRKFLRRLGLGAFFAALGATILGSFRFAFPRVLFEPSPVFKAGFPEEYPVNTTSAKWIKENVWIVREEKGFYALSTACTHLGCATRWIKAENKFKCFCHGSGFYKDGVNFEGPAPRALERLKITLDDDGQILIDRSVKFLYEEGEWDKPDAFLKV